MLRTSLFLIQCVIFVALGCQPTDGSVNSAHVASSSPVAENELRSVVMKIWEDAAKGDVSELSAAQYIEQYIPNPCAGSSPPIGRNVTKNLICWLRPLTKIDYSGRINIY